MATTTLLSEGAARAIGYDWHGGQMSGLYSFASTGRPTDIDLVRAIHEVTEEIACLPGRESHCESPRLRALLTYLEARARDRGIEV